MDNFKQDHVLYLKDFLTLDECKGVVDRMWEAYHDRITFIDAFKLSNSAQGLFDDYLLAKKDFFEEIIGEPIKPSYSYSRIYRPNQVLEPHVDRANTEFNVSITAGYEGDSIWPLYYLDYEQSTAYTSKHGTGWFETFKHPGTRVDMNIGDGFLFDRNIIHWRNAYIEGQWQVQLFLVYMRK